MPTPVASITTQTATPDDDGGVLIRTYADALPALTPAQRQAFDRQCSAAKADDWGTRTKALNVLHDAERFARIIHDALAAPRGGLGYTTARFLYFLEGILTLRGAIEVDRGKGRTVGTAQVSIGKAHEDALLGRELLIERLSAFAEGDEVRVQQIADAAGTSKDDDALLRSLKALVDCTKDCMASSDAVDQALAESVGLNPALVADIEARRAVLSEARSAALGEGPKMRQLDSAATNRIEGRVLFEMRYAMRLFDGAHGRDALSPRLIPATGTRQVLARSRPKKAEAQVPAQPSPPAGGQPATQPATQPGQLPR
jgi:hypothetical protein